MSIEGVFVLTSTCPPANSVLRLEVILPVADGASTVRMKASMTVLRVDHDMAGIGRSGFSAMGTGFSLRTFSNRATQTVTRLITQSKASVGDKE